MDDDVGRFHGNDQVLKTSHSTAQIPWLRRVMHLYYSGLFGFMLQLCTISYVVGSSVNKVFGERFAGPVTMVVTIVGQQQCVKECLARPKLCKGVNYLKKHLLCEMVSSIEESEPSSDYTRISIDHVRTFFFRNGLALVRDLKIHQPKKRFKSLLKHFC